MVRLLYWLDFRLHRMFVSIGDWAWQKPHRPFIVWIGTVLLVTSCLGGILEVLDWTIRK